MNRGFDARTAIADASRRAGLDLLTGHTVAVLVVFVLLERSTRRLALIPGADLDRRFLPVAAVTARPLIALVLIIGFAALAWRSRARLLIRWSDLEHGRRLRVVAGAVMAVVVWRLAAGAHNFYFDQWYTADRLVLVVLFVAALARPVALIPLVIETRLLQAPLRAPSVLTPGLNIDELAIQVGIALAAVTLLTIVGARVSSVAVLPVAVAAIAAQFFLPGRTKVRAQWIDNDIRELPLSGYAQGWLGDGDGSFAQSLSDVIGRVEPALIALTILFELGVILMVVRRSLLVAGLLAAIGFHIVVLLSIGFVFLEFVVVEVAVLSAVWGGRGREWSHPAFRPGPALVGAVAVLFGSWIFNPPTLAWFDTTLTYAFEIDGIDEAGNAYALEPTDFAPYDDTVAFGALELGPSEPLVGAYGAASRSTWEAVREFTSLEEVAASETNRNPIGNRDSVVVLQRFLESTRGGRSTIAFLPRPPDHFLISRPGADYDGEPLRRLVVHRVTVLRIDGERLVRREQVADIVLRESGAVLVGIDA